MPKLPFQTGQKLPKYPEEGRVQGGRELFETFLSYPYWKERKYKQRKKRQTMVFIYLFFPFLDGDKKKCKKEKEQRKIVWDP